MALFRLEVMPMYQRKRAKVYICLRCQMTFSPYRQDRVPDRCSNCASRQWFQPRELGFEPKVKIAR